MYLFYEADLNIFIIGIVLVLFLKEKLVAHKIARLQFIFILLCEGIQKQRLEKKLIS